MIFTLKEENFIIQNLIYKQYLIKIFQNFLIIIKLYNEIMYYHFNLILN